MMNFWPPNTPCARFGAAAEGAVLVQGATGAAWPEATDAELDVVAAPEPEALPFCRIPAFDR